MANGTAAADSSSSSSLTPPPEATSSPKNGRKPRGGSSSPWSSIVRGESDPAAPPSPPPSATVALAGTIPTGEPLVGTADTSTLARSESSDEAGMNGGNVAATPSKGEKKSAWNVPQNGAVERRPPVMGAELWPALSESTKASPRSSSSDLLAIATEGSYSPSPQELVSPTPASKPSGNNVNLNNHGPPLKQKSMKRNSRSSGSGSTANGGPAPPSPTAAGENPQTTSARTSAEPELSPREHNRNNGGSWDHAPSPRTGGFSPVTHGRNEHHRSYGGGGGHRRNNNAGSTNHNNFGSRRDDRGNNEWNAHPNFRGRDVQLPQQHQQRPPQRPFIRGPMPGPPPFVNPPSPVRAYVNPLGFPDISPLYYIPAPPPPPDVFRPMPYVPPPMFIPHANPQLAFAVLKQIEFYFSPDNLCKDLYLRQNMDGEGWVPISLVASFNRVRQLTGDINFVLESVCNSSILEVQGDRIRRRGDWISWILPTPVSPTLSSLHSSDASDSLATRIRNIELDGTSGQNIALTSGSVSGETSSHF